MPFMRPLITDRQTQPLPMRCPVHESIAGHVWIDHDYSAGKYWPPDPFPRCTEPGCTRELEYEATPASERVERPREDEGA